METRITHMRTSVPVFLALILTETACLAQVPEVETTTITTPAAAVVVSTRTYIDKLSDADYTVRKEAVTFLGMEKNKKNLPYLLKKLKDPNGEVRRVAVEACVRTGAAKAIGPAILETLKTEKEVGTINATIDALSRVKYMEAIPEIKKNLSHPFPTVRTYAVKALGEYADEESYPLVVDKLVDPAEGVRLEAMKVVINHKIKSAEPALIENLGYPMGIIRRESARALGEVGSPKSIEALLKLKDDKDKSVISAVNQAIENINKRSAGQ